jgi:hypothetical protein
MLRLFTDHPHSVDETYFEHFCFALGFGARMMLGGLACAVHAVLPFLCTTTGSRTVLALHDVIRRSKQRHAKTPEFQASFQSAGSGI